MTRGRTPISSGGGPVSSREMWNPEPRATERAPDGPGAVGMLADWTGLGGMPVYYVAPYTYHVQLGGACLLCPADLDNGSGMPDEAVDINDLLYFLVQFENGAVASDIDDGGSSGTPDGGVDIDDLLFFLVRFEAGC